MPPDDRRAAGVGAVVDRLAPWLLVAVQLALFALIHPVGDFPIADDWAYAHSVRWLLDERRIRLSDWVGMNLLPQTLAGGAASVVFGYSFATLRAVTQVVSILVAQAAFRWFVASGFARRDALVAALVVVATPLWGILSNSYMTDLYGMLFAIPAAALFVRALSAPTFPLLAVATLLAAAGVLERQVVAVVPAAFAIAWLATVRPLGLRGVCIALAPFAVAAGAELAYYAFLAQGTGVPEGQKWLHGRTLDAVRKLAVDEQVELTQLKNWGLEPTFVVLHYGYRHWVVWNAAQIAGYLGLFAAPWALWRWLPTGRGARIAVCVGTAAIATASFAFAWWPPYRENNLVDAAGIGPFTLYDALPRGLFGIDRSPGVVWRVAGLGAAFGIAILACAGASAARALFAARNAERATTWFVVAILAGYLIPFVLTDCFDRYLLFVLPFALALVRRDPTAAPPAARAAALAWIACALTLGAAATHDYFAWNRARWAAIDAAHRLGGTAETVDGGFEYNGYYRFNATPRGPAPGKSWWWVLDDRYVVAFSVPPGYVERQRIPVDRWLSPTPTTIFLCERASPP